MSNRYGKCFCGGDGNLCGGIMNDLGERGQGAISSVDVAPCSRASSDVSYGQRLKRKELRRKLGTV